MFSKHRNGSVCKLEEDYRVSCPIRDSQRRDDGRVSTIGMLLELVDRLVAGAMDGGDRYSPSRLSHMLAKFKYLTKTIAIAVLCEHSRNIDDDDMNLEDGLTQDRCWCKIL